MTRQQHRVVVKMIAFWLTLLVGVVGIRAQSSDYYSSGSWKWNSSWTSDDGSDTWYTWEDLRCEEESCATAHGSRICRCDSLCEFFDDCCHDYTNSQLQDAAFSVFKATGLWECTTFDKMCGNLLYRVRNYGFQLISACPETWTDVQVRDACASHSTDESVVLDDRGLHFRNRNCAKCNGANMATLEIYIDFMDTCPNTDKCAYFYNFTTGTRDPHLCFLQMESLCPTDAVVNSTIIANCQIDFTPIVIDYTIYRNRDCALCHGKFPIVGYSTPSCPGKELSHDVYFSCVGDPLYIVFFAFSRSQLIVAKVTFGISCAALLLTFITYCIFKSLQTIQGVLVMHFVVVLFLAQILLQFVTPELKKYSLYVTMYYPEGSMSCQVIAMSSHFFSLAGFAWMTVLALDLSHSLSSSVTLARRDSIATKRFLIYSLFGWGFPIVIVGSCVGVHFYSTRRGVYDTMYYGGTDCWLHPELRTIEAFLIPVVLCLMINLFLFVIVIYRLRKIKQECKVLKTGHRSDQARKESNAALRLYIKISCLFGFGWLFGYLAAFVSKPELWYVFIVLNSIQGVLFFLSFGLNARVRKLWQEKYNERLGKSISLKQSNLSSAGGTNYKTARLTLTSKLEEGNTANSL